MPATRGDAPPEDNSVPLPSARCGAGTEEGTAPQYMSNPRSLIQQDRKVWCESTHCAGTPLHRPVTGNVCSQRGGARASF